MRSAAHDFDVSLCGSQQIWRWSSMSGPGLSDARSVTDNQQIARFKLTLLALGRSEDGVGVEVGELVDGCLNHCFGVAHSGEGTQSVTEAC